MTVMLAERFEILVQDHIKSYIRKVAVYKHVDNTIIVPLSFIKVFEVSIADQEVVDRISK